MAIERTSKDPDVILLILDSVRADHLSCYGYHRPTSPHLDHFASQATIFENAFANSSWSLPSHASMFTGLYPDHHGLYDHGVSWESSAATLPQKLRSANYETACVTANPWIKQGGLDSGFESLWEIGTEGGSSWPIETVNKYLGKLKRALFLTGGESRKALRIGKEFIEGYTGAKPLFLFMNFMEAHHPYLPPRPYHSKFNPHPLRSYLRIKDLAIRTYREGKASDALFKDAIDLYNAEICYLDTLIDDFLKALKAQNMFQDSLIIVTSDHGEQFGKHSINGKRLMGHEFSLYDALLRVPLIVKYPSQTNQVVSETPVELVDILPTVMAQLNSDKEGEESYDGKVLARGTVDMAGRKLWAEYRPSQIQMNKLKRILSENGEEDEIEKFDVRLRSIRKNQFKLIFDQKTMDAQLFDTAADPEEQNDLSTRLPQKVEELRDELGPCPLWLRDSSSSNKRVKQEEVKNRLQDLGYL